jgi:hypothetical protein
MALLTEFERHAAQTMGMLVFANPFLSERITLEKQVLGDAFIETDADWNVRFGSGAEHPNLELLSERAEAQVQMIRTRLLEGGKATQ